MTIPPFLPLAFVLLAQSFSDVLETGKAIGTQSNQVLLGCLIVVLIGMVAYMARSQNKLHEKIDLERKEMNDERRTRNEALISVVVDNTKAMMANVAASETNATAIDNLTNYIRERVK